MNVGNIDITTTDQSVTLRMRHLVEGHPGAVLSFDEVRTLIGRLEQAVTRKSTPPTAADDLEELLG